MRLEDLTDEQLEIAKACNTREERQAFIKDYSIELDDDMLDDVAGGDNPPWKKTPNPYSQGKDCPKRNPRKPHVYEKTGNKRSGKIFWFWNEYEYRCRFCGKTKWD